MKTVSVVEYFEEMGYDWKNDRDSIEHILELTKTRPKNNPPEKYVPSAGVEQTYLVKAIAESLGVKNYFEIGTGRGTSCYAVSLLPHVENIITVDIVSHFTKKNEAINSKPVVVSNADLYEMIKFEEKDKIRFKHVSELPYIVEDHEEEMDLAFIDGNHTDYDIVMQDYLNCKKVLKPGGTVIFDDYHPEKFIVKKVVHDILEQDKSIEATLVCVTGHIFETDKKKTDSGMVVFKV